MNINDFDPFSRGRGSLYHRGVEDSYHRRPRRPHYGFADSDFPEEVLIFDEDIRAVAEYNAGYDANERDGLHKEGD